MNRNIRTAHIALADQTMMKKFVRARNAVGVYIGMGTFGNAQTALTRKQIKNIKQRIKT